LAETSLALSLAMAVLWVRSFHKNDAIIEDDSVDIRLLVVSRLGEILIEGPDEDWSTREHRTFGTLHYLSEDGAGTYGPEQGRVFYFLGFQYLPPGHDKVFSRLDVPDWFVMVVLLTLPIA
jgi:hypothetical protein